MIFPYHVLPQVKIFADLSAYDPERVRIILGRLQLRHRLLHSSTYVITVPDTTEDEVRDLVSEINQALERR